MYGLDNDEMQTLQHVFSQTKGLDEVVLYGSRAKGTNKPFSDIDITLKGKTLTGDDLADVCSKLSESSLPYFCDVSLFHRLTSPSLIEHINRRGKILYKHVVDKPE